MEIGGLLRSTQIRASVRGPFRYHALPGKLIECFNLHYSACLCGTFRRWDLGANGTFANSIVSTSSQQG